MEWAEQHQIELMGNWTSLSATGSFKRIEPLVLEPLMIWVTDAKPLERFRLWVKFSDASHGEVDLADLIANDHRPIVAALRDPTAFAAIRVEMDTVVWSNGFDLAPEYLRARLTTAAIV